MVWIVAVGTWTAPLIGQVAVPADRELDAPAPATGEIKTIGVIAAARYEKLIDDIAFMGSLAGKPEAGQMIEGLIAFVTQGKGVNALDKTQPWGLILQTDGARLLPIGCLPVTKHSDLLDIAKAYGAQITDANDGVQQILLPNQQSYFVKHTNGWSFIGISADSLASLPDDPRATLADLVTDYDLAARVSVKDVPEAWRQLAIAWMQMGMQQGLQQRAGESDEQHEIRQKLAEGQMEQFSRMVNEIDAVTVGWAVDPTQQRTFVDFTYAFVPGSKMAEQIAAYGQPRTNFAGFYQPDAAATVTFATQADPDVIQQDIAQFETMTRTLREQLNKAIDENDELTINDEARDALKAAAGDLIDAFETTIKAGQIDGGATLHLAADSMTFVGGALVKDPAKIESGLKKLDVAARQNKNAEYTGIKWNAASHAGVNFHTLEMPVPAEQEGPRKLLGSDLNVAVGIGPESVYLAVGRENLNAVKQAIDASAAEPDKAVPPFELAVSLAPIMEMAAAQADEGDQKAVAQAVADMLRDEAPGRDHIRAVGQVVPNGLRYRFEAEEGVLRAIGKVANEAQRKRLQANQ